MQDSSVALPGSGTADYNPLKMRGPHAKIFKGICKWYNSQRGFGFIIPVSVNEKGIVIIILGISRACYSCAVYYLLSIRILSIYFFVKLSLFTRESLSINRSCAYIVCPCRETRSWCLETCSCTTPSFTRTASARWTPGSSSSSPWSRRRASGTPRASPAWMARMSKASVSYKRIILIMMTLFATTRVSYGPKIIDFNLSLLISHTIPLVLR